MLRELLRLIRDNKLRPIQHLHPDLRLDEQPPLPFACKSKPQHRQLKAAHDSLSLFRAAGFQCEIAQGELGGVLHAGMASGAQAKMHDLTCLACPHGCWYGVQWGNGAAAAAAKGRRWAGRLRQPPWLPRSASTSTKT